MEIKFKAKRNDEQVEEVFTLEDISNLRDDFYSYENWRQFTTITDKKDVEIYVGDRIKYHHNSSKFLISFTAEVVFKDGAYYAYWSREMLGKVEHHYDLLSKYDRRYIRVIGNVFEE